MHIEHPDNMSTNTRELQINKIYLYNIHVKSIIYIIHDITLFRTIFKGY